MTLVGTHDLALITLDTLRHDVAVEELAAGRTPNLARLVRQLGSARHSPGTFTYAAHAAFFAGFLPTPACAGPPSASVRARASTAARPSAADDVRARRRDRSSRASRRASYHTLCVGGVGFFNRQTRSAACCRSLFAEPLAAGLGVTDPRSFEHQIDAVESRCSACRPIAARSRSSTCRRCTSRIPSISPAAEQDRARRMPRRCATSTPTCRGSFDVLAPARPGVRDRVQRSRHRSTAKTATSAIASRIRS